LQDLVELVHQQQQVIQQQREEILGLRNEVLDLAIQVEDLRMSRDQLSEVLMSVPEWRDVYLSRFKTTEVEGGEETADDTAEAGCAIM
jgi:hypothetical protein